MLYSYSFRRLFMLVTALVILAGALAPTVSRALAQPVSNSSGWVEVCTAQGFKVIPIDKVSTEQTDHGTLSMDHCPFCLPQFHTALLPTCLTNTASSPVQLRTLVPHLFLSAPRMLYAWTSALPRAPPVLV